MITLKDAQKRSRIIKALAHPVRIMMVEFLTSGEKSFSDIFNLFNLDKSTVSKHLLVLKEVDLISSKKDGWDMRYKLEIPCVTDFFSCVTEVITHRNKKRQTCTCKK